jgi:hypothetical protein
MASKVAEKRVSFLLRQTVQHELIDTCTAAEGILPINGSFQELLM